MEARLKLWEIASELEEIGSLLADGGGELTPELEARLDAMEGALETKVENIALFVKECEANAAAAESERDRLSAIAKHHTTKANALRTYLLATMNRLGQTSVKTPRIRVWAQANGRPSIRFAGDIERLPAAYVRVKTTREVDTRFAFVELQAGATLPEGFVVDHGRHLRIG